MPSAPTFSRPRGGGLAAAAAVAASEEEEEDRNSAQGGGDGSCSGSDADAWEPESVPRDRFLRRVRSGRGRGGIVIFCIS